MLPCSEIEGKEQAMASLIAEGSRFNLRAWLHSFCNRLTALQQERHYKSELRAAELHFDHAIEFAREGDGVSAMTAYREGFSHTSRDPDLEPEARAAFRKVVLALECYMSTIEDQEALSPEDADRMARLRRVFAGPLAQQIRNLCYTELPLTLDGMAEFQMALARR